MASLEWLGAGGGNRTRMEQAPLDFESSASTNFTTPAKWLFFNETIYEIIETLSRSLVEASIRLGNAAFLQNITFGFLTGFITWTKLGVGT